MAGRQLKAPATAAPRNPRQVNFISIPLRCANRRRHRNCNCAAPSRSDSVDPLRRLDRERRSRHRAKFVPSMGWRRAIRCRHSHLDHAAAPSRSFRGDRRRRVDRERCGGGRAELDRRRSGKGRAGDRDGCPAGYRAVGWAERRHGRNGAKTALISRPGKVVIEGYLPPCIGVARGTANDHALVAKRLGADRRRTGRWSWVDVDLACRRDGLANRKVGAGVSVTATD